MHRCASIAVIAVSLACATSASAQRITGPRTQGPATISSTAKAIPSAQATADAAAMTTAAKESLFTIRASYLATTKGSTTATKQLAADLIAYHTQALSDFRGALLVSAMKAPAVSLTADQEKKLSVLESLTGVAFDTAYRTEVVASQTRASSTLLNHGKSKGNLIIVAQANRQGNQIAALNTKTKVR